MIVLLSYLGDCDRDMVDKESDFLLFSGLNYLTWSFTIRVERV